MSEVDLKGLDTVVVKALGLKIPTLDLVVIGWVLVIVEGTNFIDGIDGTRLRGKGSIGA